MYLDDYSYGEFLRLLQVARARRAFIVRPEIEGEPWIIKRNGRVLATCDSLEDVERELGWLSDGNVGNA